MVQQKRLQCYFCQTGNVPYLAQVSDLEKFLSERGKIVGRKRSGVCSKHQRRLTKAIKQARFLALLPFAPTTK